MSLVTRTNAFATRRVAYYVSKRISSHKVSVGRVFNGPIVIDFHHSVCRLGDAHNRVRVRPIRLPVIVKDRDVDWRIGKSYIFIVICGA